MESFPMRKNSFSGRLRSVKAPYDVMQRFTEDSRIRVAFNVPAFFTPLLT